MNKPTERLRAESVDATGFGPLPPTALPAAAVEAALAEERWRPIPDCPGYLVSDLGRVQNAATGLILTGRRHTNGYRRVTLNKRDRYIHELVLGAFVGPRPSRRHEADHWDRDRANNALSNLQWLTLSQNRERRANRRGSGHPFAKLTEAQAFEIRSTPREIASRVLAARFGISREQARDIRNRKCWKHV